MKKFIQWLKDNKDPVLLIVSIITLGLFIIGITSIKDSTLNPTEEVSKWRYLTYLIISVSIGIISKLIWEIFKVKNKM